MRPTSIYIDVGLFNLVIGGENRSDDGATDSCTETEAEVRNFGTSEPQDLRFPEPRGQKDAKVHLYCHDIGERAEYLQ